MSRYRGPKVKILRRLKDLPGLTTKTSKKTNRPGKDKNFREMNKKLSEYATRLEEKQKLKFNYGLTESQLFKYVKEARRRKGVTGLILLQLLEMRLDTLCFTLGFAKSIGQARQLVNHGHIVVNGKVLNIPSFQCRLNDVINVRDKVTSKSIISTNLKKNKPNNLKKNKPNNFKKNKPNNFKKTQRNEIPSNLKFDANKLEAVVLDYCDRNDVKLQINELLVIEYYSRR